jgi:hypothetical protein
MFLVIAAYALFHSQAVIPLEYILVVEVKC